MHKSGTVLFTTKDKFIALNRAQHGWRVEEMNDIAALKVTMKVEEISPERMEWLKKLADMEYCANNPGHWLMNLKETNYLATLALQCLENNLALVEALEARDKQIADYASRLNRLEKCCDHKDSVYWGVSGVKRCARCAAGIQVIEGEE